MAVVLEALCCPFLCGCHAVLLRKKLFDMHVDWLSLSSSSGETQPPKCGSVKVDHLKNVCTDSLFKEVYDESEDEDDEVGYADPIQDDLYARQMGRKSQPFGNDCHDQFLPKLWTPEEDFHIQKIKLGSQRRPWYKKIQGFRSVDYFAAKKILSIMFFSHIKSKF